MRQEPAPRQVDKAAAREIDDLHDLFDGSFLVPRRVGRAARSAGRPAANVNTLGEVPDSAWYTNRPAQRPMSIEELVRGPGNSTPPDQATSWRIVSAKKNGVTPGFVIEDGRGRRYLMKFDPPRYPELASAADVIGSKFFYALGYNTPENYIVRFARRQLELSQSATWRDDAGRKHRLTERMVDRMLADQPRDNAGRYRAVASRFIAGKILGPFRYEGTRSDDPNDIVPHEDRRELRGLAVFAAWLNHTDARSINSLDALVTEGGQRFIKHYLIDFGATLGSDSLAPKDPRLGHEYFVDAKPAGLQVATLGFYLPRWTRASFPDLTGVGHFDADTFEPQQWKPTYAIPAFLRADPEDAFWAAKQVVAFTDQQIRAIVRTGEYSDPRAAEWIARCLILRRDKIGRAYFSQLLALDKFLVEDGSLVFEDLSAQARISPPKTYHAQWFTFDNERNERRIIPGVRGFAVADALRAVPGARYLAVTIQADNPDDVKQNHRLIVYLLRAGDAAHVVGVDRIV